MKQNLQFLNEKKGKKSKIIMLSCYDYPTSLLAEQAGVDIILVGDSVGTKIPGRSAAHLRCSISEPLPILRTAAGPGFVLSKLNQ